MAAQLCNASPDRWQLARMLCMILHVSRQWAAKSRKVLWHILNGTVYVHFKSLFQTGDGTFAD